MVDLFYGQYKSRVECCDCKEVSVRYDAFNSLSVEVPQATTFTIECQIIYPNNFLGRHSISLSEGAQIGHIKNEMTELLNLKRRSLVCLRIEDGVTKQVYSTYTKVTGLLSKWTSIYL